MRTAYKYLAYLITVLTMIQAASIAWVVSGLFKYISQGGVLDAESQPDFPEIMGFMIHGINGTMIMPAAALLLVILSFGTKVRGALMWALIVLGLLILQIALGMFGQTTSISAFVHGLNGVLLFGASVIAGWRVRANARQAVAGERTVEGV